jgi:hypothetical protein
MLNFDWNNLYINVDVDCAKQFDRRTVLQLQVEILQAAKRAVTSTFPKMPSNFLLLPLNFPKRLRSCHRQDDNDGEKLKKKKKKIEGRRKKNSSRTNFSPI